MICTLFLFNVNINLLSKNLFIAFYVVCCYITPLYKSTTNFKLLTLFVKRHIVLLLYFMSLDNMSELASEPLTY